MDIRPQYVQKRPRIVFTENKSIIHHEQACNNGQPVLFSLKGTALSLQAPGNTVAVYAHDKNVAEACGFRQILDMAGMDDIKAAVCRNKGSPLFSRLINGITDSQNGLQCVIF